MTGNITVRKDAIFAGLLFVASASILAGLLLWETTWVDANWQILPLVTRMAAWLVTIGIWSVINVPIFWVIDSEVSK